MDIDHEALAKAAVAGSARSQTYIGIARAVVAALREQGVVLVRAEDAARLLDWIEQTRYRVPAPTNVVKAMMHVDAALAAPGPADAAEDVAITG